MEQSIYKDLDGLIGSVRGASYAAGLKNLAQVGTVPGSLGAAKAIGSKIPAINLGVNLYEAGHLAVNPELRAYRTQQLEQNANASPLLSAGSGIINPVGTLYGFGALLNQMFDSNSAARRSGMAAEQAQQAFNARHPNGLVKAINK